jgi:hypothetical protein
VNIFSDLAQFMFDRVQYWTLRTLYLKSRQGVAVVAINLIICDSRELSTVFPICVRKVRSNMLSQKAH